MMDSSVHINLTSLPSITAGENTKKQLHMIISQGEAPLSKHEHQQAIRCPHLSTFVFVFLPPVACPESDFDLKKRQRTEERERES